MVGVIEIIISVVFLLLAGLLIYAKVKPLLKPARPAAPAPTAPAPPTRGWRQRIPLGWIIVLVVAGVFGYLLYTGAFSGLGDPTSLDSKAGKFLHYWILPVETPKGATPGLEGNVYTYTLPAKPESGGAFSLFRNGLMPGHKFVITAEALTERDGKRETRTDANGMPIGGSPSSYSTEALMTNVSAGKVIGFVMPVSGTQVSPYFEVGKSAKIEIFSNYIKVNGKEIKVNKTISNDFLYLTTNYPSQDSSVEGWIKVKLKYE